MDEMHVSSHGQLCVNGEPNFHINEIEVFTGDDDYNETDCVQLKSISEKLQVTLASPLTNKKSPYRLRNEPGVRIKFTSEDDQKLRTLLICHHKGGIYIHLLDNKEETL